MMKHHIIVKFNEKVTDKAAILTPIQALFEEALTIPGIYGVHLYPNCVMRDNRYDLMIVLDMEPEALTAYDHSEPHIRWKQEYGEMIAQKAIFDCTV